MEDSSDKELYELGDNDDEVERLLRRKRISLSSTANRSSESSLNFSKLPNLTLTEIHDQISQCLKLNAENKINEKNAFKLHMIDFLVYSLKKQDREMNNFQMASACLEASGKIYGYRVDKVHSDLLKVVGHARGEKRGHDDNNNNENENQENRQRKRRRRNQYHILSSIESLKGNLVTYNPLNLINTHRDIQTSDMLLQVSLPQHANQGIALNIYNDVLLDRVPSNECNLTKILTFLVDDFTNCRLCPSYADFKFLEWSPEDDFEANNGSLQPVDPMDTEESEFHFNLDDPVFDDDDCVNNRSMNCIEDEEENCIRLAQSINETERINDFQDIIANNPNSNAEYEYSYIQQNQTDLVGPPHWKLKFNKDADGKTRTNKKKSSKKKEFSISYSKKSKVVCEKKYITRKKASINTKNWSEDINQSFLTTLDCDNKHFYDYFNKLTEHKTIEDQPIDIIRTHESFDLNVNLDTSKFNDNISSDVDYNESDTEQLTHENQAAVANNSEAFIGNNLVSVPSLVPKTFIPYSQRAKRIDMHKLNKATEKILLKNKDENGNIRPIMFGSIYSELPKILCKTNAESMSVGLSMVSLLHVVHKNNLILSKQNDLCDLVISNHKNNR